MKLLFTGEAGLKDLWIRVDELLEITVGNSYWIDLRSEKLRNIIEEGVYEIVVLVPAGSVTSIKLMDLSALIARKRKHFIIVSEISEEELKKELLIDDMDGGSEFFYHVQKSSSIEETSENIIKKIKEIFS
jgi:hypothetical protein